MSDDFLPSYIVLQHKWKEEVVGETPAGVKDRPVPPSGDWLRTLLQAGLQCFDFQRSVRGTNTAVRSRHPSRASPVPFNPAERGLSYILSAPLVQFWWRSKQCASSQRSVHALSIMAVAFCCSGKYITEIKRKGSSKAISLYTWGGAVCTQAGAQFWNVLALCKCAAVYVRGKEKKCENKHFLPSALWPPN